jgi:hypothetical protein
MSNESGASAPKVNPEFQKALAELLHQLTNQNVHGELVGFVFTAVSINGGVRNMRLYHESSKLLVLGGSSVNHHDLCMEVSMTEAPESIDNELHELRAAGNA